MALPSSAITTFTRLGVSRISELARDAAVPSGNRPADTSSAAPSHRFRADERLIALNVDDSAVSGKAWLRGNLCNALSPGRVLVAGHNALGPGRANGGRHGFVVCSHDDGISDVHLRDSLPDPDDEGESGKETEWFAGEAHSAEARRNDH